MHDISIISIVFVAILALSCLFLVLSPFFKWETHLSFTGKGNDAASMKESLLTTLNELEFEYKMDKMSQADYKNLKKQYEEQISILMKEEENVKELHVDKDLMAEVEKEIEEQMKSYKNKKGEGK